MNETTDSREITPCTDPAYLRHIADRGEWLRDYCTCRTRPDGSRFFTCKNGCGREGKACGGYCPSCFLTVMKTARQPPQAVIDAKHLAHQREWSERTFGPGQRTLGVLDHIGKELDEIRADPTDLDEWVDVIILAFDGAWRHGWEPQQIIDAIKAKQAKNEARTWPDWRTMSPDKAIEHDRSGE